MDIHGIESRLRDVDGRLETHEQICSQRYQQIVDEGKRMRHELLDISKLIRNVGLLLMAGMASILVSQLFK